MPGQGWCTSASTRPRASCSAWQTCASCRRRALLGGGGGDSGGPSAGGGQGVWVQWAVCHTARSPLARRPGLQRGLLACAPSNHPAGTPRPSRSWASRRARSARASPALPAPAAPRAARAVSARRRLRPPACLCPCVTLAGASKGHRFTGGWAGKVEVVERRVCTSVYGCDGGKAVMGNMRGITNTHTNGRGALRKGGGGAAGAAARTPNAHSRYPGGQVSTRVGRPAAGQAWALRSRAPGTAPRARRKTLRK